MSIVIDEFAKRARAARRAKEWSQLDLGRRLGHRSAQFVWKFENGVVDGDADTRRKLAHALGIQVPR